MERFWDFKIKKEIELLPLFLNESFRGVVITLLSLFSSIFVYRIFFSLSGQGKIALLAAVLYYLGVEIFKFLATLAAEELSLRFGLKKQIYIGEIFLMLCLIALFFSQNKPALLVFASIFLGVSSGFFWFGRHGMLAKIGEERAFGKELGVSSVINTLLMFCTPFLGGVLVSIGGYPTMFVASLFVVLVGASFLKGISEKKTQHDTTLGEVLGLFMAHPRDFLAYAGNAAAGQIGVVIFPLYLFFILKKELSLGEFFSLSLISAALINLWVGRWVDLRGKKTVLRMGAGSSALVWVGRALTKFVPVLLILNIIDNFTAGMTGIPLGVLSYEKAVGGHATGRAILFRELAICLGSISACILIMLVILSGLNLEFIFLGAAIFSLFPLLVIGHE